MRILAMVTMVAVVLEPRPADACTCLIEDAALSPTPGATNVPINPAFVLRALRDGQRPAITAADGTTIVLEVETLLAGSITGTHLLGRSPIELQPNTRYTVNFGQVSFTTGDSRDDTAPSAIGLAAMTPEVMAWPNSECQSSCFTPRDERISRFRFSYTQPDDVVFAMVEIYRQGTTEKIRAPLGDLVGRDACDAVVPTVDPEATYCARTIAYDASGNQTVGEERCSAPSSCATERDPQQTCAPSNQCKVAAGGCSTSSGSGWLVVALFAFSRGWSRRSARRRPLRVPPSAP